MHNLHFSWETASEVIFMAKKGMKRPDLQEKPGKMPIVPQIQGKAKSGKVKANPIIAGTMGAAFINGVQSKGVGTSLKHFAANNQEYKRQNGDSQLDERTLREIYLPAFEMAVKEAAPETVMCSYNRIYGTYLSDSKKMLTDILRDEWGFKGIVVSD